MTTKALGTPGSLTIRTWLRIFLIIASSFGIALPAAAQTTSTWTGGAGNWSNCPQDGGSALWNTCPTYPSGNYNAVINGGPVTATSASIVNLTIDSGSSLLFASGTSGLLQITGTSLVNNGSINIASLDGFQVVGPTSLTLSGSGSVTINGSHFTASSTPTVTNQQTIQGNGSFSLGMNLINQGVVNATGGTLAMQPSSVVNTGTLEASSGGTLAFNTGGPVPYTNTGGIIQALNGGVVQMNGSVYTGGTLTTSGTGVIQADGDAILNSLTNNGTVQATAASLEGTITNNGTISIATNALNADGPVTLTGSGSILMSGTSNLRPLNGSGDSLTSKQLIHGSGTIYQLSLTNQGTIEADSKGNTLYVDGGATTNTATMEASGGGILQLDTVVNNTGGTIEAQTGSTVIFTSNFNGSINGGTLTTSGTGIIESQNGVLDGTVNTPTNAGKLDVKGMNLYIQGAINNTGTIALTGNSCVVLNEPSTLTGSGKMTMASTTCIYGSGEAFTNASTIEGSGSIGDSNPMPITNTGTILANQKSALLIVPNSAGFTNTGKLLVNNGSTLMIHAPFNSLSSAGTLTSGTYTVTGTLGLPGAVVTNDAAITLTGAAAEIQNTSTGTNTLSALASNATTGTLSLQSGQALATSTNYSNSGKTTVGASSSFTVGGTYTQLAGTTTVYGTVTAPAGFSLEKGSLLGKGTIVSAVTSNASVTAGDSSTKPGKLAITGSYTQQSEGTLNISLGGTAAGTFGELATTNGVSLTGTLSLKLINGFVPAVGDTFTILTGSAVSGTFTTVKGESINSGEHFEVNYNGNSVTLTVASGA